VLITTVKGIKAQATKKHLRKKGWSEVWVEQSEQKGKECPQNGEKTKYIWPPH
jgi:hypothetical protein